MARVWDSSKHGGTDLLMLLGIADCADDSGNAYPSVAKLAEKCRTTPRHANRILAVLRESGELEIRQNKGPRGVNRYQVKVGPSTPLAPTSSPTNTSPLTHMSALTSSSPLTPTSSTPDVHVPKPLTPTSDEPSMNHQEPSKGRPSAAVSPRRAKKTGMLLGEFLEECQASRMMAIPVDDPIYGYAEQVGIHDDMLAACWAAFRAYYTAGNGIDKRQKDWRAHYRNSVRGNWYKLWFFPEGQNAAWTTAGEQARREMAAQHNDAGVRNECH